MRAIFVALLCVLTMAGRAEAADKTTVQKIGELQGEIEKAISERFKGATFHVNPGLILEHFAADVKDLYVHYGPELPYGRKRDPIGRPNDTEFTSHSTRGNEAFWRDKLGDYVWYSFVFKDGSQVSFAVRMTPVERAVALNGNTQDVRATLKAPFIEETTQLHGVGFAPIDGTYHRVKNPREAFGRFRSTPLRLDIHGYGRDGRADMAIGSAMDSPPPTPFYNATEIENYWARPQTAPRTHR